LGRRAESAVAELLRAAGWVILARNARTRYGEIDLVGLVDGTLVFVEVKAGRSGRRTGPERPALAIGPAKQRRIRSLARAWLAAAGSLPRYRAIRFDAVGVSFDQDGNFPVIEHIENAF
jgi:putative endonuclease